MKVFILTLALAICFTTTIFEGGRIKTCQVCNNGTWITCF